MTLQTSPPTNRSSVIAFILAVLTLVSFCIGVAPIPLTGLFCYPPAVILGVVALLYGFRGLRQIRVSGEKGRGLALFGITSGVLTILMIFFLITLTIVFLLYGASAIQNIWQLPVGPNV